MYEDQLILKLFFSIMVIIDYVIGTKDSKRIAKFDRTQFAI